MALVDKKSLYDLVQGDGPVNSMGSLQGPQFANPEQYTPSLHEDGLSGIYNSSVHSLPYGPMTPDLDGNPGPSFANTIESTIHTNGLTGLYNSTVHKNKYTMALYDMNGQTPSQYLNNLPEGLPTLIG